MEKAVGDKGRQRELSVLSAQCFWKPQADLKRSDHSRPLQLVWSVQAPPSMTSASCCVLRLALLFQGLARPLLP